MKREYCEYVKKCVFQNIASTNYGRITLGQVYRLFSDYGSLKELEKCLDSFVKEGVAVKLNEGGAKIYVFKEIATKFEKKWKEQLENLQKQKNVILNDKAEREAKVKVLNKLYTLWHEGWKDIKNPLLKSGIKNYISIFWQSTLKECVKSIQELERKLVLIEEDIRKIENMLERGV